MNCFNDERRPGKVEQKERFVELRAVGKSFANISKELGVSKPTLISWSKEMALDIQNACGLRLDELSQSYVVAKEKRIEAFGKRLNTILMELDKRDLALLETDKLLTLALKYAEMLRIEYEPLTLAEKRGFAEINLDAGTDTWQA